MTEKKYTYVTAFRIRMKQKLIAYKGGKCERCGYNKDVPGAYHFHHKNPKEKDFAISDSGVLCRGKLYTEADKCELVCANCHAELHDNSEVRLEILSKHQEWLDKLLKPQKCPYCEGEFQPSKRGQKGCSKCYLDRKKKVKNRPTKLELKKMIETMTWLDIAKKYQVRDNSIRKWAKYYGLRWNARSKKLPRKVESKR